MTSVRPPAPLLAALAVALCGSLWGIFWLPLHWLQARGVGGGWVSLVFNLVSMLAPLPWLARRTNWRGFAHHAPAGLLLGLAFSLYSVALVMTDVLHAILLFYLTPVWSSLAGWLLFRAPLTGARLAAIALGFAGMAAILGVDQGLPLPRNLGDWVALASGMFWAAGTMHSFARPARGVALPVFTFSLGGSLAAAAILAVGVQMNLPMALSGSLWAQLPLIILLALIFFVPPNYLILWAAQRVDPGRIGILLTTEVMVGSLSASLLSGQSFGWHEQAGTLLIFAAALAEVLGKR